MKDPAFTILLACLAGAMIGYAIEMIKIEIDYNKKRKELMKSYKK